MPQIRSFYRVETKLHHMDSQDMHLIGYIIAFIAGIGITRSVFGISTFLKHVKAQTKISMLMANKLGCDSGALGKIEKEINEQTFLERINN